MMHFETAKRREASTTPRVSVVIPSYNHQTYVAETIRSVLSQTFQDFELIIIDDGSKDSSVDVIRRLVDEFSDRNILFIARENVGLCRTLNEGLRLSRGEFFAYLGSDDIWEPEKLEKQLDALLAAGEDYGAAYSDCWMINDSGERIGRLSRMYNYRGGDIYEDVVWNRSMPHSPTNLFWRSAVVRAGGFNESHAVEDRDLWVRLSRLYKVAYVDIPLASWRSHGANNGSDVMKMYEYGCSILRSILRDDPRFTSDEGRLWAELDSTHAYACFAAGLRSEARAAAFRSIRNNPFSILPWRVLFSSGVPENLLNLLRSIKKNLPRKPIQVI